MQKIDLAGTWALSQRRRSEASAKRTAVVAGPLPMKVPGDNFTALIEAGKIPDPYFGTNELDTLWVGRSDWLISRSVTVEREFLAGRHVFLHIDSLDTCVEVRLNGKTAAESGNMFKALRADISKFLRAGENSIEVLIRSPERQAAELARLLPYPVPHSLYPLQSPHRNLLRKVQCHSGWDWGPCLMVSGLYGAVYLGSSEIGRIDYVTTDQTRRGSVWRLTVNIEYFAYRRAEIPLEIAVADRLLSKSVAVQPGLNLCREVLQIRDPELWWPAGQGAQFLHCLRVKAGEDQVEKRIGFRTIEVLRQDDRNGRSLTFCINGRKIFCKGANWIPVDALPGRQTPERYEKLLSAAVAANMNMLRVWGGGQYEADLFYNLCDQKGILIWQDFMFSCSTYPALPWFLQEAEEEVRHQVKRLKDHPCLALWCGNNENLGALNWYPESRAHPARYLVDYDRLNEGVVGRVVRELDPGRTWWPSSPSAGEGDYSDNWHDDSKGDMHYWSVWHEGKSFEGYYEVIPRFCSEFGFQSFPSLESVRSYAPQAEWNLTSPVMEHHQRNPRGNTIIVETMTRYFRLPESFEGLLYLSQVQQALAMKTAVEYWRSRRPVCMGSLYWQLNDLWPVASWSSIEHSGKWKLLHYAARRFYAPVHVAVFCADGERVEIVGINDTRKPVRRNLAVWFVDFSGRVRLEKRIDAVLAPEAATPLASYPLAELPAGREELFLAVELSGGRGSGREAARELSLPAASIANELFLCPPKRCNLEEPGISRGLRSDGDEIVVELESARPAFFVSLDAQGMAGVFDDNLFTLLPGKTKTVRFLPEAQGSQQRKRGIEKDFDTALKILHLRATYR